MAILKTRSLRREVVWAAALSLFALPGLLLLPSPGGAQTPDRSDPGAVDQAYAEVVMVDQFLSTLTGGAQGLPKMDQVNQAMIAKALMEGDAEAAAAGAYDYLVSKAAHAIGGAPASAALAAVGLGETLGMAAHEVFGEGRLRDLYADLSQDTNASTWPRSYAEAKQDDFVGGRFEIEVRPVMEWLKAQDEGRMSDSYYEAQAYHSMVAMRDFEMGCDQYGLEGVDRTPEKLREALDDEMGMAAAEARGVRDAELFTLEMNRKLVEVEEAARKAAAARDSARIAEAEDARRLEAESARLDEEAARYQAALDSMRVALLAEQAETAAATGAPAEPTPEVSPESLGISLVNSEKTGSDMTTFRVRVTNNGGSPISGLLPEVRAARLPPGGGVAWAGGEGPRILGPGESVELSFVGTGEIEAAVLYLSAQGQLLAAPTFEVAHVTEPEPEPTPEPISGDGEWIDLPARFEGTEVTTWTFQIEDQIVTDTFECKLSASIDSEGAWKLMRLPCTHTRPGLEMVSEDGIDLVYRGIAEPYAFSGSEQNWALPATGGRVNAARITAGYEAVVDHVREQGMEISTQASSDRLWWRVATRNPQSGQIHTTVENTLKRVR